MAITNGYCTLAELKDRLGIDDADDNSSLESVIEGVSRWIDDYTGRRFYATSEARYFTPDHFDYVRIDDLLSVTTVKTDEDGDRTYEITWASTDYDLVPFNSTPYQALSTTPNGDYTFPTHAKALEIDGSWGYSSTTPRAVREACILGSMRWWHRKNAVFGIGGQTEFGIQIVKTSIKTDPDIINMLIGFKPLT